MVQRVLDAVVPATHGEHVSDEASGGTVSVTRRQAELDAIVGQDGVDFVGHRFDESCEKGRCGDTICLVHQLHEGELAGPVDGNEEVELSFGGLYLGDVDVEVADRVALERLLRRFAALDLGQTADPMAQQAAMQ